MILEFLGITTTANVTSGLCCCQSFPKSNENRSGIFPPYGSFSLVTEERRLHSWWTLNHIFRFTLINLPMKQVEARSS